MPEHRTTYLGWLIDALEDWWGEELTRQLADKIASSPADQIVALSEALDSGSPPVDMGHLIPAGSIRPFVASASVWRRWTPEANMPTALRLLLYVPEVTIEEDFTEELFDLRSTGYITPESRSRLASTLRQLADLRPLALSGVIHLTRPASNLSKARHPSRAVQMNEPIEDPVLVTLANQLAEVPAGITLDPLDVAAILYSHFGVLYLACSYAQHRLATPLARSEAEMQVLSFALRSELGDGRHSLVSTLARLPVPDFGSDARLLAKLRSDDDAFDNWRGKLGSALAIIDKLPDTADMGDAADIVRSELSAATRNVSAAVDKSPVLQAAKGGLRRIGIGAIGATSTGLMTGSPTAALVTLGATQLADTAWGYVSELKKRRSDRLVMDVVTSFTQAHG